MFHLDFPAFAQKMPRKSTSAFQKSFHNLFKFNPHDCFFTWGPFLNGRKSMGFAGDLFIYIYKALLIGVISEPIEGSEHAKQPHVLNHLLSAGRMMLDA